MHEHSTPGTPELNERNSIVAFIGPSPWLQMRTIFRRHSSVVPTQESIYREIKKKPTLKKIKHKFTSVASHNKPLSRGLTAYRHFSYNLIPGATDVHPTRCIFILPAGTVYASVRVWEKWLRNGSRAWVSSDSFFLPCYDFPKSMVACLSPRRRRVHE